MEEIIDIGSGFLEWKLYIIIIKNEFGWFCGTSWCLGYQHLCILEFSHLYTEYILLYFIPLTKYNIKPNDNGMNRGWIIMHLLILLFVISLFRAMSMDPGAIS